MTWDRELLGYHEVRDGGSAVVRRAALNFTGGLTVSDNPTTGATDVDVTGAPLTDTGQDGTVSALGSLNTVLTSDGSTAGGVWSKVTSSMLDGTVAQSWDEVLALGATTGGTSPLLSSGDAYDTDTGVPLTLARSGTTAAVFNGGIWDFQAHAIVTDIYYQTGVTPSATGSWFRVGNNMSAKARNAANTADVSMLVLSAADVVLVGDATNAAAVFLDANNIVRVRVAGTDEFTVNASTVDCKGNNVTGVGAGALPATGALRIGLTDPVIRTRDSGDSVDLDMIGRDSDEAIVVGDPSMFAVKIPDVTAPATDPSAGHYVYSDSGALKGRGSSGTITPIAAA